MFGKNTEEHNEMLQKLLLRCSEKNIKLNNKVYLQCNYNIILSHEITCHGLNATNKKTDAVGMMNDPIDKEEVRRVLGTVNYLSKFLPNLANVVEPLKRLTHNDVAWT